LEATVPSLNNLNVIISSIVCKKIVKFLSLGGIGPIEEASAMSRFAKAKTRWVVRVVLGDLRFGVCGAGLGKSRILNRRQGEQHGKDTARAIAPLPELRQS
jgi:hypothetical protein